MLTLAAIWCYYNVGITQPRTPAKNVALQYKMNSYHQAVVMVKEQGCYCFSNV